MTLTVEGHEYPSVEHYYQACKLYTLGGAQLAAQIRRISDAGQVKVFAKRLLRKAGVSPEKVVPSTFLFDLFHVIYVHNLSFVSPPPSLPLLLLLPPVAPRRFLIS